MNRLKELRTEKGLTQQELADVVDVTKLTIANWENEKHKVKSDKAQQLADFFGVHVPYLLGYSPIRTMEEEISTMIDNFNQDFIEFLKYHDLYLSDSQIPLIINTMYSMSNINDRYLMTFMKNEDFKGLEIAKRLEFNKLFEYSGFWDMQYTNLEKLSQTSSNSQSQVIALDELQNILKELDNK